MAGPLAIGTKVLVAGWGMGTITADDGSANYTIQPTDAYVGGVLWSGSGHLRLVPYASASVATFHEPYKTGQVGPSAGELWGSPNLGASTP